MNVLLLFISALVILIIVEISVAIWKNKNLSNRQINLENESEHIRNKRITEAERIKVARGIVKKEQNETNKATKQNDPVVENSPQETKSLIELDQVLPSNKTHRSANKAEATIHPERAIGLSCFVGFLRNVINSSVNPRGSDTAVHYSWDSHIYDTNGCVLGFQHISPLIDNGVQIDSYLSNGLPVSTERFMLLCNLDRFTSHFWFNHGSQGLFDRQFILINNGFVETIIKDSKDNIISYESYCANRGDFSSEPNWAETLNYRDWEVLINDKDRNQIGWQRIRSTDFHCVVDFNYKNQPHRNTREHYRKRQWAEVTDVGGYDRYKSVCKFKDSEYNEPMPQPKLQSGNLLVADDWDLPLQVKLAKKTRS
jgi:hypothetical protein